MNYIERDSKIESKTRITHCELLQVTSKQLNPKSRAKKSANRRVLGPSQGSSLAEGDRKYTH